MPLHSRFAAVGLALFVMINVRGQADTLSFSLIPADGNISGPAGSTIGWGYSITNDSMTNWLVTAALTSDTFAFGTPNATFDFPNVAPGATITLAYAQSSGSGLFELTWDSSALVGFENFGRFILSSQWWNGDPLGGGTYLQQCL